MANESAGGEPLRCFFALMSWKLARILARFGDFGEEDKNDYTETTKSENKICSVFFHFPCGFSLILRGSSSIIYTEACMSIFQRIFDGIHASGKSSLAIKMFIKIREGFILNKVMTLHDAVAKYVENGDTLAIGGFTTNRKP